MVNNAQFSKARKRTFRKSAIGAVSNQLLILQIRRSDFLLVQTIEDWLSLTDLLGCDFLSLRELLI
ncbi:hypothetical protein AEM38_03370 [Hyphomonadaceae bacterium UKL13-1]|nr:hypothetical protein AEM38_03370 [Hyphomonadaceae bacterium UKL13-1]